MKNQQILTIEAALVEQQKFFKETKCVDATTRIKMLKKALNAAKKAQEWYETALSS